MDTGGIGSFPGLTLPTLEADNRLMFQRKEVMDKITLLPWINETITKSRPGSR